MLRKFLSRTLLVGGGIFLAASAQAADFSWSGFGSAYYAQAINTGVLPFNLMNATPDFTDFSLVGLNVNSKLADHWTAGAQLVALGDRTTAINTVYANFGIQASWAHITYKSDDGFQVRAGRQRFAVFTASEYIYERYELPYREMPAVVYQMAPFVAFDGVSVSQEIDLGVGKFNVQVFGGSPVLAIVPPTGGSVQLSNLLGARINFEGDGWRIRVQASRSHSANLNNSNVIVAAANNSYYSAGYRFDKYNIVSWGEVVFRHAPDGTISPTFGKYVGTGLGAYFLAGYHIDKWMPRYTIATASAHLGAVGSGQTTTHTFGLNYYFNPKVAAKAEYELITIPNAGGGFKTTQPFNSAATSGGTLYVGLDFLM